MFLVHAPGQIPLLCDAAEPQGRSASGQILESQLPLVRANLEGPDDVWVGQAVSLNVEVIVPTWFSDSPKFPDIEIENALVLSTGDAVNSVVRSGGKTFSGQDRQYLVFPQTAGDYTVPPVSVSVSYALPEGKKSPPTAYASSALTFTARIPQAAAGAKYFLTADRFEIEQSFDRKLDGLKVGDAIVRSVRMTAENTASMMLPALAFEAPDGIRCYPGEPNASDRTERGTIEAARTETATYVPTQAGKYRIPEIAVEWWAPREQKMNTARLAPLDFTVEEPPERTSEVFSSSANRFSHMPATPGPTGLRTLMSRAFILSGFVLLLFASWRFWSAKGAWVRDRLAKRRNRKAEAEITFFRRFRKASVSNDARTSLRELMFWLDRIDSGPTVPTLASFSRESNMPELVGESDKIQACLYASPGGTERFSPRTKWLGKPLCQTVTRVRRARKRNLRNPRQSRRELFSLNPDQSRSKFW